MGNIVQGSQHGMAKLKEEDVLRIRELYASGEKSMVQLAYEYDITENAVYKIIKKHRWKHI